MERTRISHHEIAGKYLAVAGIGYSGYLLWETRFGHDAVLVTSVFFILVVLLTIQHLRACSLEFDDQHLYIIRPNQCRQIPLAQILAVRWTANRINHSLLWAIRYYDEGRAEQTILFTPWREGDRFENFKYIVLEKNQQAEIQSEVFLFDWDC